MPKAIIIGATSGIGRALALLYASRGYEIGATGRREVLLAELAAELGSCGTVCCFDVRRTREAMVQLAKLFEALGRVDVCIVNAGCGYVNPQLDWTKEQATIETNVCGFAAICNVAMRNFIARGGGRLVGISSVAGIRGVGGAPAYSASKAFISNYLESLRGIVRRGKLPISVTDIRPGFVDTAMGQNPSAFWRISPEEAAAQIYEAVEDRKARAYVAARWRLVAIALQILPDRLIDAIGD